ncbi:DUF488 family protein [Phenylobacterium sp.]|uniref:DUF488 domain-containing protein n=1 Tax=Phenylobacterium sp. TaxID=1871053 RepID=UPI003BA9EC4F
MIKAKEARRPFFTIGHSTRSVDEIAGLLHEVGAQTIVDVRKLPRSRANPQFNIDALSGELHRRQIGYRHIAALGGLRGREPMLRASPNTFWQNKSFRNYSDYATTPAFQAGLAELIAVGAQQTCAIMCSEVLWWRCHRRIIADYLLADGAEVLHLLGPGDVRPAVLTTGVKRVGESLLYQERDGGSSSVGALSPGRTATWVRR